MLSHTYGHSSTGQFSLTNAFADVNYCEKEQRIVLTKFVLTKSGDELWTDMPKRGF